MNDKNLSHPEIEIFYEYLDRELDYKKSSYFEEHLNKCQKCKGELRDLKELYKKVESLNEKDIGFNFADSVIGVLSESYPVNSIFRQSIIFQVFFSLMIFISMIVFQIPMDSSLPKLLVDWFSSIDLNWTIDLHLPNFSFPAFDALKTIDYSFYIPTLPELPELNSKFIVPFVITSGILWLFANRIFLSPQNRSTNYKTQNGG